MKKTGKALTIVSVVFLAAILAYVAVYLVSSLNDGYQTSAAVDYTVRDTVSVYGMVVRDEEVLKTGYQTVYVEAEEGKRVSGGGVIGAVYSTDEDLRRAERLRDVTEQIESLEALESGGSPDTQKLESGIKSEILALRRAVQARELDEVDGRSLSIATLLFSSASDAQGVSAQLNSLRSEAATLQSSVSRVSATVTAPSSGLYSSALDGFEDLKPADVAGISASDLKKLIGERREAPEKAIGKLVYGSNWYYASVMSAESARRFEKGDRVTMIFGRYYSEVLQMQVVSVSVPENGEAAVVFACEEAMADTLTMRVQSAEIILGEDHGIRVSKRAIRMDEDGTIFVYVQTGIQVEKKTVEILFDVGDYYVVRGPKLHAGDELIVSGKDLYPGKVVN